MLQYLRSESPSFDVSEATNRGDPDYSFCVQRPGEIFSIKVRRPFIDGRSKSEIESEVRRIELGAAVRRLGAALVTPSGTIESLAK